MNDGSLIAAYSNARAEGAIVMSHVVHAGSPRNVPV
jgi:hypothetical protein